MDKNKEFDKLANEMLDKTLAHTIARDLKRIIASPIEWGGFAYWSIPMQEVTHETKRATVGEV